MPGQHKKILRVCPACGQNKLFDTRNKTCGCAGRGVAAASATQQKDVITENKRTISIPETRIHTLEQLIEAFEIDTSVWQVKEFTARKWDMGYIAEQVATTTKQSDKTSNTHKTYTADHKELYAVSAVLTRIYNEVEKDDLAGENAKLLKQNKRLSMQLSAEKRYRDKLLIGAAVYEEALQQIKDVAHQLGEFKFQTTQITHSKLPDWKLPINEGHTEDAVLLLSDTHCGDVIRPGDTSGFPEYDLPICGNRFGYVIEKAKQILTMHRAMYPIKKLYIWLGGDMGNGDLHDAPVSNALFIGPQVDFTFKMIKIGLEDLLELTVPDPVTGVRVVEEVVLLFTCGNHMRESSCINMPMKYQSQRTFDWLIYQMLIEWFKGTPRVTVREGMSPYIFEDIRGHRHLFAHGMQVGYRNSPDAQVKSMDNFLKIVRGLFDSPEFRRKNNLQGPTFARACIGDIHVPVEFPRLISNGSLNGQNELGVNWGLEPIPAGQQLFGVTEKHLQTFHYFVNCTHVQKEASDWNNYGHFAAEYERQFGRK